MLNDTTLRNLKPKAKAYKKNDANGLYVYVTTKGRRVFRIDYAFEKTRRTLTLGEYPYISLAEARKELAELKIKLNQGIDPQAEKKAEEEAHLAKTQYVFENIAREWFDMKKDSLRESTAKKIIQTLQNNIFPFLGKLPISEIKANEVWEVLRKIEQRGKLDTLSHAKNVCSQIFCYGVATGRCEYDVTSGLKGVFKKPKRTSFAALTDHQLIGKLLRDIDSALMENKRVSLITMAAIKLIMYTMTRSQEVCMAKWEEFDFEKKIWTIPGSHKKENRDHIVPLSRQALAVIEEIRPFTEDSGFVFASDRSKSGHIAGESLSKTLREILGYKDKQTIHGFRAMASTILNEKAYNPDVIEKALAHNDRNEIRAIYNRAEYFEERKKMLQEYADYLDELKAEGGE